MQNKRRDLKRAKGGSEVDDSKSQSTDISRFSSISTTFPQPPLPVHVSPLPPSNSPPPPPPSSPPSSSHPFVHTLKSTQRTGLDSIHHFPPRRSRTLGAMSYIYPCLSQRRHASPLVQDPSLNPLSGGANRSTCRLNSTSGLRSKPSSLTAFRTRLEPHIICTPPHGEVSAALRLPHLRAPASLLVP